MAERQEILCATVEGEDMLKTILRVCLRYAEGIVRNADTPLVGEDFRKLIHANPAMPKFGVGSVAHTLAVNLSAPFHELYLKGELCREDCEAALTMDWFSGMAHLYRAAAKRRASKSRLTG